MSRRLGLIIGVNQYQDSAFRTLQFAENDARALAQWLVNTKGGKWSPSDVQLVQGSHATHELVSSLITRLCVQMAGPGDLAVIYFAGHTYVDERNGEGYLALTNTHHSDPTTGVSLLSVVQQALTRSRASQILCILDCFQSGPAWARQRTFSADYKPLFGPSMMATLQQGNRFLLCSCRGNELLAETGERNLGTFMFQSIIGLVGSANPSTPGRVNLQQFTTYLSAALDEQHRPQIFGQERTPFLLVGEAPTPPPAAPSDISPPPITRSERPFAPQAATLSQRRPTSGQLLNPTAAAPSVEQQAKAFLAQAQQMVQMQQHAEALALVEQALALQTDDKQALVLRGQLLGTLGRAPEALATVEHLLQADPQSALAWSMRAVLLTNAGRYQEALHDIERSLELQPTNQESFAIKNSIMANISVSAAQVANGPSPSGRLAYTQQGAPPGKKTTSFLRGAGIQLGGFLLGLLGTLLPILIRQFPMVLSLALESLGLAILSANAARGAFRYGGRRLGLTLIFCLLAGVILGATALLGFTKILAQLALHQTLLVPVLFLALWLALATLLPLLFGIVGLIIGLIRRKRA